MLPLSVHMVAWSSTRAGLPAAARLGFRSAEIFALALWGNDPADVAGWLRATGISVSAVYLDLPPDPAEAAAATTRAAGSIVALGSVPTMPATTLGHDGAPLAPRSRLVVSANGDRAAAIASVAAAGAAAAAAGIRLCLHPHQHTAVESRADAEAVLAATDPDQVWVCADTGHLLAAGDDPASAIADWAPRLAAVHLKDIDDGGRVVALGTGRLALAGTLAAIDTAVVGGAPIEHLTLEIEDHDDPEPALLASVAAVGAAARAVSTREAR